jgi:hypothetical protein
VALSRMDTRLLKTSDSEDTNPKENKQKTDPHLGRPYERGDL